MNPPPSALPPLPLAGEGWGEGGGAGAALDTLTPTLSRKREMEKDERVFIGLGANLGDAGATLDQALRDIAALPNTRLVKASSHYRTAPVGTEGPDFINAVAEITTALEPQALLAALQRIEQAHGRERSSPGAPRTLDLDLLLHGQRLVKTAALTVPHPRLPQRAFVLQPLAEIAPGLRHPVLGAIAELAKLVADKGDQPIEKLP